MSDDLKPCPFCGGRPALLDHNAEYQIQYSVFCRDCWAQSVEVDDTETAIFAWNRRVEEKNK